VNVFVIDGFAGIVAVFCLLPHLLQKRALSGSLFPQYMQNILDLLTLLLLFKSKVTEIQA
jgi:hypothetical protein